jgi:FtsH-binding integral membrane protein
MERHIKVARAHRAISWLYAVCLATFLLVIFLNASDKQGFFVGMIFVSVIFLGLFLLHHFTAKGARNREPWARISSIIISIFLLFGFPLGTLIGIYLLSNTWSKWDEPRTYKGSLADGWPTQDKVSDSA